MGSRALERVGVRPWDPIRLGSHWTRGAEPSRGPSPPSPHQAVKSKKHIPINVILINGESLTVMVDSASTSREICQHIAQKQDLRDYLGFSLQVAVYDKVRVAPVFHLWPLIRSQPGHHLPHLP